MDLWERFRQFQERTRRGASVVPGTARAPTTLPASASDEPPEPSAVGWPPVDPDGAGAWGGVGIEQRRRWTAAELGLQCEETPAGPSYFLETLYPLHHRHGILGLGSFLDLPAAGLAILAQPPQALPPTAWLFLDTETTGLQGGPGTIVFLCGLARFAQDTLVVRQYLAPDPAAEPALIWAVLKDLAGCEGIVSFNGRTFDWPLIRDRVVLARLPLPPDPAHADLLFPARWLFRSRLSSCRLTHLESEVLRCPREDDIPSELIPEVYRVFLRGAPARTLAPVLEHNRHDLLSLVVLAARLLAPWLRAEEAEPEELYGLARMLWARGHGSRAVPLWEKALAGLPPLLAARAGEELGRIYRRMGQPHEAARIWQAVVRDGPLSHPGPLVELAKYYEHVVHDHEAARRCTLRALEAARHRAVLALPGSPSPVPPQPDPASPGLAGHAGCPVQHNPVPGANCTEAAARRGSGASVPELLHRLQRLERRLKGRGASPAGNVSAGYPPRNARPRPDGPSRASNVRLERTPRDDRPRPDGASGDGSLSAGGTPPDRD